MGANVVIRTACLPSESALFSVYTSNDTHVAQPGYFSNQVCYPKEIIVNLRTGNCNSEENCIFSQFSQNDSHISSCNFFNYSLCSPNINCRLTTSSCDSVSLGSLHQADNSHWGDTNYFNQTLCCLKFPETTSVGGGGVVIDIEDEEEVEEIEEKLKIDIRKIADKIKDMGKEIIFFFAIFLFMVFIYKKKEKCYYCKKKFKVKDLLLYKNRNCCKSCYEAQKGKE